MKPIRFQIGITMLCTAALCCAACFQDDKKATSVSGYSTTGQHDTIYLLGAGASFPSPLYQNWFISLAREHPYIKINYQAIGSGAGIQLFSIRAIDFGASDVPMTPEEVNRCHREILQLPMTAGALVLSYNIPGITNLNLTRQALEGIFTGKILFWNDPAIRTSNPNVTLPYSRITVVHRADGSGTTHLFTKTMSTMSQAFQNEIGAGMTVEWPATGNFVGARGNEGVAEMIRQNRSSIGYLEYGYSQKAELPVALIENHDGYFADPSPQNVKATIEMVSPGEELTTTVADLAGQESYPFITYTWLLLNKVYNNAEKAEAMEEIVEYGLGKGQNTASELGYIPLPQETRKRIALLADTISATHHLSIE